jgi:hypothetical protein
LDAKVVGRHLGTEEKVHVSRPTLPDSPVENKNSDPRL